MNEPTYYGLYSKTQRIWLGATSNNIFWTTSRIVAEVQRHSIMGGDWIVRVFSDDLDLPAVAQAVVDLRDRQETASAKALREAESFNEKFRKLAEADAKRIEDNLLSRIDKVHEDLIENTKAAEEYLLSKRQS